jgi:hypothetical protein
MKIKIIPEESLSSEEQNQISNELELEKPLKLRSLERRHSCLGHPTTKILLKKMNKFKPRPIVRPEPGTKEHWEKFSAFLAEQQEL